MIDMLRPNPRPKFVITLVCQKREVFGKFCFLGVNGFVDKKAVIKPSKDKHGFEQCRHYFPDPRVSDKLGKPSFLDMRKIG